MSVNAAEFDEAMDILETIAQALWRADKSDLVNTWDKVPAIRQDNYRRMARAAIKAWREHPLSRL